MSMDKSPEGRWGNDVKPLRVSIVLEGEAALRLMMWADSNYVTKNLAAKRMLLSGMIEKGLLLKSYLEP